MTRKEAERLARQAQALQSLGFTADEAEALRRISRTLQRWHEAECNGEIQRGEDGIARGYRVNASYLDPNDPRYWYSVRDRETGARKRLAAILDRVNVQRAGKVGRLASFIQGDPRGAALYIIRPGDVPEGASVDSYYTRGICVY